MAAPKSTQHLLRRILKDRSFDQLTPFRNVAYSQKLPLPERQLAAQLLTLQGREQLQTRQPDWMETLSLALQVAPDAWEVLEQQGDLWLELARRRATADSAQRAIDLYKQVVDLKPGRFEGWWGYAQALMESCPQRPCMDLLHRAAEALDRARALIPNEDETLASHVNWNTARVRAALAEQTQEAGDWAQAAALYQQAVTLHSPAICWIEYTQTLVQLNCATGLKAPITHAAEALKTAATLDANGFAEWDLLQRIVERWAMVARDDEPFTWATALLRFLSQRQKKEYRLRLCWGQVLLAAGHMGDQEEAWREAMAKFEAARRFGAPEHLITPPWCQAAACYGLAIDKLKYIQTADNQLKQAIETTGMTSPLRQSQAIVRLSRALFFLDAEQLRQAAELLRAVVEESDTATSWYWLASCLLHQSEIGSDDQAAREAADCAQQAILRDRHYVNAWRLAGESLLRIGERDQDPALLQRAANYFAQAIDLWGSDKAPPELLNHYGSTLDLLGELTQQPTHDEQALEILRTAHRRDRHSLPCTLALSAALHRIGDERANPQLLYEALIYLLEAMRDEPDEGTLWGQAGAICLTLWRQDQDAALLDRAHEYLAQSALLGAPQAHLYLAALYASTGRHEIAFEALEKAARYGALPPLSDLLRDDWFEPLRASPLFRPWFERHFRDEELSE